jgi:hypothetical protein
MNDKERKQWIHNDQNLFNWFNSCNIGLSRFIKINRVQIDSFIQCIN